MARFVEEASARFQLPPIWLDAVISAESGGDYRAISPKGAMGLMQLMPGTWRDLSAQHGLGDDPFDPRANVLAGAAYLRQLFDQFVFRLAKVTPFSGISASKNDPLSLRL